MTAPVDSPTLNPLVKELGLLKHPEGGRLGPSAGNRIALITRWAGYFHETDRQRDEVPSPFAGELRVMVS